MTKRFRDLPEDQKAAHSVAEGGGDESLVYCTNCGRAMKQGDCVVDDDLDIKLRCAYGNCVFESSIAVQSIYWWEDYRDKYKDETAHWPETPTPGECYTPSGDAP